MDQVHVLDGDGAFQDRKVEAFMAGIPRSEGRANYQVVAIMGPQSSGKSTLLNNVFGTSFVMMDAMAGRSQTTKGIWMALSDKIAEPRTLVMDLEGADGRERGEDDTNFERQSALFALANADVLLVNIWCHDVGREQGAGKPLLKTIFQVNLKLFAPDPTRKRTVLLFVFRDKTKTPLTRLIETMEADLDKMWGGISKPAQYEDSKLSDFFDVQYAALSHYEEKQEDFMADCVTLRRRFTPDGDDSLVASADHLPIDSLALSMRSIWEVIRSQKDLNLPAHKVMVANIRCAEIKADQLRALEGDQAWVSLLVAASGGALVPGFGAAAAALLDSCIQGYNAEAVYFDSRVRAEKLEELVAKLEQVAGVPVGQQAGALSDARFGELQQGLTAALSGSGGDGFASNAARLRAAALDAYAAGFEAEVRVAGFPWDGQEQVTAFTQRVDAHIASVRSQRIASAMATSERALVSTLSGPCVSLLDACPPNLWARLQALSADAAKGAQRSVAAQLGGFGLGAEEMADLAERLAAAAWGRVEAHAREGALTRMSRMKDKFTEAFTLDRNKTPRTWGTRDDIPAIARDARAAAAGVLAQLAVVRPPTAPAALSKAYAGIEAAVARLVADDTAAGGGAAGTAADAFSSIGAADDHFIDILSAASWPGVPEGEVMLQPHEVRTTWREFTSTSNNAVQSALAMQQANKLANNRSVPWWAIAAMCVLGWNELMAVLTRPMLLIASLIAYMFLRTLYYELDVEGELTKGSLPGAIALASKIGPATQTVVARTVEALQSIAKDLPGSASRAQEYFLGHGSEEIGSSSSNLKAADEVQMAAMPNANAMAGSSSSSASADGLKQRRMAAANADSM
ncbi:hypothetical protein FOA52_005092 [Chlamydomonas sp. UWO 241]|nr:hypothetical protein FOA52_005092 [Chlamydomonas sp. UWO 241]